MFEQASEIQFRWYKTYEGFDASDHTETNYIPQNNEIDNLLVSRNRAVRCVSCECVRWYQILRSAPQQMDIKQKMIVSTHEKNLGLLVCETNKLYVRTALRQTF